MEITPPPVQTPLSVLMQRALDEARTLARLEVELAKNEAKKEAREAATSAVSFGVAAVLALLALVMLLLALVLALSFKPLTALLVALALLAIGAGVGFFGYRALPREPMAQTRRRLSVDVRAFKEQLS